MELFKMTIITLAVVFLIFFGLNSWEKNLKRQSCLVFSKESGRQTKFVEYTRWTRDCLTPLDTGVWISTYNLQG